MCLKETDMNDLAIARWTGMFGVATVVCWLAQFPLYMIGEVAASAYDGPAIIAHYQSISTVAFVRILLDQGVYVCLMIFAAGFRHLLRQARQDYEWLGTLLFGAAAVWLGVTLVADGLAGGTALDAIGSNPDPSVARALLMGTLLIYNSSTAFVMTALFLGVAGFGILGTKILPAWTGWLAYVGAALCLLFVPTMFNGAVDYKAVYNVGGWAPAAIANFPPALWFLAVGIMLIRRPAAPTRAGAATAPTSSQTSSP
jgi:hypothetical protein